MTKFQPATTPPSEYERIRKAYLEKPLSWFTAYVGHFPTQAEKMAVIDNALEDLKVDSVWRNDTYQVSIRPADTGESFPEMLHLSIKRIDREPIHDWRELQAIKDQLVGPENEGVELYPAHSRVVDTANQYHLFVLKDPKIRFPFGFPSRVVHDADENLAGSKQRPL